MKGPRKAWLAVAVALALVGSAQVAAAGWIHAKAWLAQRLIASSWQVARASGTAPRPWPGADIRAIARLTMPARGVDLYILEEASARALAYGPAHVSGTAWPAHRGNAVVVAHRDTHFAFLRNVAPGDEIDVQAANGAAAQYRVRDVAVVDQSETRVLDPTDTSQLTLITCWPFDAVQPGTPLRYVVVAQRVA
ncbi:MAG TPA: class GN sortase [Usitatibacter sp.]|nr:class GN sortase [Usitatibacter sp.]